MFSGRDKEYLWAIAMLTGVHANAITLTEAEETELTRILGRTVEI